MTQRQRREARPTSAPVSAPASSRAPGEGPVAEKVRATCDQIVTRNGLEPVECTLALEGRTQVLRVTVDDPSGPTALEDIERIAEEISRALDAEDPIPGRYMLEVSSAGLERPLVRPSDYERFAGREVKVRTLEPIEGRRTFTGSIRSAGDETFVLDLGTHGSDGVVEIPFTSVARAKLVVDWENELRGRPTGPVMDRVGLSGAGLEGGQQ